MYRSRHIEGKVLELAQAFKVVLINGARQVGKSTLVRHLFPQTSHITFNPVMDDYGAQADPKLFLDSNGSPLILDEIQYVPDVLPFIKLRVDECDDKGQYILTGSQNFSVLRHVSESLAGRVAIVNLGPLTAFEMAGTPNQSWVMGYLDDPEGFTKGSYALIAENQSIYELIWRGAMPGVLDMGNNLIADYYASYIQTYIERDVRLASDIRDLGQFSRFLGLCSALTAQELNSSQMGREIGITHVTARRWADLLEGSFQWFELKPFIGNTIKRITRNHKGYIGDTGVACYLQRLQSPVSLQGHPSFGGLFETYIVNMIRTIFASYANVEMYHWRSTIGAEVDLVVERDGVLFPIEIKGKTNLTKGDASGINAFIETYQDRYKIAKAVIVYLGKEVRQLTPQVVAVPWNMIMGKQ